MIDKDSWQKADGLLPPEILQHYKNGEYANKFVEWPMAKTTFPPDFKADWPLPRPLPALGEADVPAQLSGHRRESSQPVRACRSASALVDHRRIAPAEERAFR